MDALFRYQFSKSSDWHLTILLIFIDGWFIYFRVDIYKYVLHDFYRLRSVKLAILGHWKLTVREKILFLLIQHIRGHDFFVFRDIQYTWEYDGARKTVNSTNCFIFKLCWPGEQGCVKDPRWCFWWKELMAESQSSILDVWEGSEHASVKYLLISLHLLQINW